MKLLKKNIEKTIEIKKSRFITYIYRVNDESEFNQYLSDIRQKHRDARHILYAYITSDLKMGACEDKEPVNAAHRILNTLKAKDAAGIACFIVRYFGGILLGASNLDRTYVKCVFDNLSDSDFGQKVTLDVFVGKLSNNYLGIFQKRLSELGGEVLKREFMGPIVKVTFALQNNEKCKIINAYLSEVAKNDKKITKIV